jgi:hypothetical protein
MPVNKPFPSRQCITLPEGQHAPGAGLTPAKIADCRVPHAIAQASGVAPAEDLEAIRNVLIRYAHTLDYGPAEGWVDCFTEDGVFDIRTVTGLPGFAERPVLTRGSAALLAFAKDYPYAPDQYRKHKTIVSNRSNQGQHS